MDKFNSAYSLVEFLQDFSQLQITSLILHDKK